MRKASNSTYLPPESPSESNLGSHPKGKRGVIILLHPLSASCSHSPHPKAPDTMKPTKVIICTPSILCSYIISLGSATMSVKNMFLSVPPHHCCQFGTEEPCGLTWTSLQDDSLCSNRPFLTVNDGNTMFTHCIHTMNQMLC